MMNTADVEPSFEGTLAKENGCCSYRRLATVGIVTSLIVKIILQSRRMGLTHADLVPIEVSV